MPTMKKATIAIRTDMLRFKLLGKDYALIFSVNGIMVFSKKGVKLVRQDEAGLWVEVK